MCQAIVTRALCYSQLAIGEATAIIIASLLCDNDSLGHNNTSLLWRYNDITCNFPLVV